MAKILPKWSLAISFLILSIQEIKKEIILRFYIVKLLLVVSGKSYSNDVYKIHKLFLNFYEWWSISCLLSLCTGIQLSLKWHSCASCQRKLPRISLTSVRTALGTWMTKLKTWRKLSFWKGPMTWRSRQRETADSDTLFFTTAVL